MSEEAEIRKLMSEREQALYRGDAKAVAALYETGAVLFDIAPPLETRGMDAEGLEAWFQTWEGPVRVEAAELVIEAREGLAVARSLNCMTGHKKGSPGETKLWLRSTVCLRKTAAGWRVFHEHTSVPLKMDGSGQAATDLTPDSTR